MMAMWLSPRVWLGGMMGLMLGLMLGAAPPAYGQAVRYDSSAVARPTPPADALARYRADPDFTYEAAPRGESWADRVLGWLWDRIFAPLFAPRYAPVRRWVLYALVAGVMFFVVTRLLRMDRQSAFAPRGERRRNLAQLGDDLAEVALDAALAEALAGADHRRAVRLYYLLALQRLAAHKRIAWAPDKTNHAYLAELRGTPFHTPFADLTYVFDHAWYGEFAVDAAALERVRRAFGRFEAGLADAPGGLP